MMITKQQQIDTLKEREIMLIVQRDDYRDEAITAQSNIVKQLERVNRFKKECASLYAENCELLGYQRCVRDSKTKPERRLREPDRRDRHNLSDFNEIFGSQTHHIDEWWEI